jgi:hypothetical protein
VQQFKRVLGGKERKISGSFEEWKSFMIWKEPEYSSVVEN